MTNLVEIFDRTLLRRRRERAAKRIHENGFLVQRAAEDSVDRLEMINRDFPLAVNLSCHDGILSEVLEASPAKDKIDTLINCDLSGSMVKGAPAPLLIADDALLPFAPASLNLVISLLTLHMVNDLPGTLVQIAHALKPDGLFMGVLFCGDTLTELRQSFLTAEAELEGGVSPRVAPFADLRSLGGLLQRAQLALPVADTDIVTVTYDHPLKLMADLRAMGQSNCLLERRKTPLRRSTLMRVCEIYQERFGLPDGRVPATFELATLTGWAPHESQQKPLQPGSAQTSLADILGSES